MGATGAGGAASFVVHRSGPRGGRGTPMDSAMEDAMRRIKVSFGFQIMCHQRYEELRINALAP